MGVRRFAGFNLLKTPLSAAEAAKTAVFVL
jgi:hypothetical protein